MLDTPKTPPKKLTYAWYVVAVLMLAYISSFIDRQILSLLVKPIRRDFEITDTQMSLLMGFSFALFYTVLGIPIGRLADRKSRKGIISIGILLWSIMTAFCGMAANYLQLFLARVGVGVGEAALSPPAYSLISDYFPREKLGLALSVYSMGIYIGSGMAFLLGGIVISFTAGEGTMMLPLIGEIYSWQIVFFIIGLPGLLIALLISLTVKEPTRKNQFASSSAETEGEVHRASLKEVFNYIWANGKAFFGVSFGLTSLSVVAYGSAAWAPTFLQRAYDWTPAQSGIGYGTVVTIFATAGIIVGGLVGDRLSGKYPGGRIKGLLIATYGLMLSGIYYPFMPNGYLALLFLIPASFFIAFPVGVSAAAIQEMMPNHMRAAASSIYLFIINLIAMTLGPTSIALITDYVFRDDQMVGYSISIVGFFSVFFAWLSYYIAQKPYQRSLEYLRRIFKE